MQHRVNVLKTDHFHMFCFGASQISILFYLFEPNMFVIFCVILYALRFTLFQIYSYIMLYLSFSLG